METMNFCEKERTAAEWSVFDMHSGDAKYCLDWIPMWKYANLFLKQQNAFNIEIAVWIMATFQV